MVQMTKCMNLEIVCHSSIVSFKQYIKSNDLLRNEQNHWRAQTARRAESFKQLNFSW